MENSHDLSWARSPQGTSPGRGGSKPAASALEPRRWRGHPGDPRPDILWDQRKARIPDCRQTARRERCSGARRRHCAASPSDHDRTGSAFGSPADDRPRSNTSGHAIAGAGFASLIPWGECARGGRAGTLQAARAAFHRAPPGDRARRHSRIIAPESAAEARPTGQ